MVTDGFTGNVALKAIEGTAKTVVRAIRDAVRSSPVSAARRAAASAAGSGALRRELDPNTTGGAILLGLRGVAVIAHGELEPGGHRQRRPPRAARRTTSA